MAKYVFAPAGPNELRSNYMRLAIEFIGLQQNGCGSAWAKGKRYLRDNLQCSGTAIKRVCAVKEKYIMANGKAVDQRCFYFSSMSDMPFLLSKRIIV